MRKLIILILGLCVFTNVFSQKSINLILVIDDVISTSISNLNFQIQRNDGSEKIVKARYTPGNLDIDQSDFDSLFDSNVKSVFWAFEYSEIWNKRTKHYSYKINLSNKFLKDYFFILYIFNTQKTKYRKLPPLKGLNYTYEYKSPSGSMVRLYRKS